jgi:aminopeptidase-like protein
VVHITYYNKYCKECDKEYTKLDHAFCESCLINDLKINYTKWTSGNEKIDNFIQKTQLEVGIKTSVIFEWIPYNEFIDIKEIGNNCLTTAIWKEGPLYYNTYEIKWMRTSHEKVCLKYLYNSQNATDEFINKVLNFLLI